MDFNHIKGRTENQNIFASSNKIQYESLNRHLQKAQVVKGRRATKLAGTQVPSGLLPFSFSSLLLLVSQLQVSIHLQWRGRRDKEAKKSGSDAPDQLKYVYEQEGTSLLCIHVIQLSLSVPQKPFLSSFSYLKEKPNDRERLQLRSKSKKPVTIAQKQQSKRQEKNANSMYTQSSQSQKKDQQIRVHKLSEALKLKRIPKSSGIKQSF